MDLVVLSILGAGNVHVFPQLFSFLGSYHGERSLEIRLFDGDPERLDLSYRLARTLFRAQESSHHLLMAPDIEEALPPGALVWLCMDANGYGKLGAPPAEPRPEGFKPFDWHFEENAPQPVTTAAENIERGQALVREALQEREHIVRLGDTEGSVWNPAALDVEPLVLPHQILRWARQEEALPPVLLTEPADCPLRAWLNQRI